MFQTSRVLFPGNSLGLPWTYNLISSGSVIIACKPRRIAYTFWQCLMAICYPSNKQIRLGIASYEGDISMIERLVVPIYFHRYQNNLNFIPSTARRLSWLRNMRSGVGGKEPSLPRSATSGWRRF